MTKTKSTKVLTRRTSKLHSLEIKKELAQLVRKREFKIGVATFILFVAAGSILYRGVLRASPKSQVLSEGAQKQKKPDNPPVKKLADTTGQREVPPTQAADPTPASSKPSTFSQNQIVLTKNPESKKERVKDREKTLEKRKRSNEEKTQKKRHDKNREDD